MAGSITLPLRAGSWHGPFDAGTQTAARAALEAGRILLFPTLPFALSPAEHTILATPGRATPGRVPLSTGGARKNLSYDPATGALGPSPLAGADREAMARLLARFGAEAEALLRALLPTYAPALVRARASFRPAEIAGRAYRPRQDDRRLHVDAFPSRPTGGARILRLFCNIADDGAPRRWRVGEPFADFATTFLPRLRGPLPGHSWLLARLRLTHGTRSPYDWLMLGLHDTAKLDTAWQSTARAAELSFPPATTWCCFTDMVLHAALSGHAALEQTFHLPVAAMAEPERAPLRVLERLTGRTLELRGAAGRRKKVVLS